MPRSNTPVEPLPVCHNSPINVEGTDKEGPLARYGVLKRVTVMYGAVSIKVSSVDPYYFPCDYCSGISIQHDEERESLWMDQRQYIQSLLKRYGLSQAKSATTPADVNVKLVKNDGVSKPVNQVNYQSMVGSLLYASIATRPDVAQAVGAVSKFNSCPTETHLIAVKRIFRYLKGTINLCIKYERSADNRLVGFSDVDWAGDMNDRHSTTGNLFMRSGAAIAWSSKKQPVVALSTAEAEYVALSAATQEAVWLSRLLSDIKAPPQTPILIKEDNQGTIAVARNPVSHNRTKHIDIKFHYVQEALEDGIINLIYRIAPNFCSTKFHNFRNDMKVTKIFLTKLLLQLFSVLNMRQDEEFVSLL